MVPLPGRPEAALRPAGDGVRCGLRGEPGRGPVHVVGVGAVDGEQQVTAGPLGRDGGVLRERRAAAPRRADPRRTPRPPAGRSRPSP